MDLLKSQAPIKIQKSSILGILKSVWVGVGGAVGLQCKLWSFLSWRLEFEDGPGPELECACMLHTFNQFIICMFSDGAVLSTQNEIYTFF